MRATCVRTTEYGGAPTAKDIQKTPISIAGGGPPIRSTLITLSSPFTAVAQQAQISRATLYRDPQLRAIVDEHRTRQTDARTLTGLATEVAHLRTAVEALAEGVKRHKEQLRRITKPPSRR